MSTPRKKSAHGVQVRASRCEHCGAAVPMWTPELMIEAARAHHAKTGQPPTRREWEIAGYDHPSAWTVSGFFLTFENLLVAAGLVPPWKRWTRREAIQALFEDVFQRGRVPVGREWRRAHPERLRPTYHTVLNLFGSWNAFLRAAGYQPTKEWTPSSEQTAAVA